jgi:hypothetical protein
MQNTENGTTTNNSSWVQKVKSLFQGKPVSSVTHTHHHTYQTIRMSDLSLDKQMAFDQLFTDLFKEVQPLKN